MMTNNAPTKQVQCRGVGTMTAAPMTIEELKEIKDRADAIEDEQIKLDIFRLLKVARKLLVEQREATNGG